MKEENYKLEPVNVTDANGNVVGGKEMANALMPRSNRPIFKEPNKMLHELACKQAGLKLDADFDDVNYYNRISLLEYVAYVKGFKANEPFEGFWKRLETFVSNVQVADAMSEEEKEMIIATCKKKQE